MNDWTKSEGVPEGAIGGFIVQDASCASVLHLGLARGATGYLRSDDGGKSFSAPGVGPGSSVEWLAVCPAAPRRLYAILGERKAAVALSDDSGKSWRRAAMRGLVASSSAQPYNLAVDPNDAGRLYLVLGGSSSCLWRSTDSGESWSRMDRGLSGRPTHPSMVIAPMLAITRSGIKVALLGGGRLARIGPGEDRWQDATPRAPKVTAEFLVADPHHASRLWRTGAGRLWRSDDGRRWEKLPGPENIKHVTCDAKKPGRLAVVASANAWLTTDGGRRWRSLGSRPSDLLSSTVFAGENLVGLSMSGIFWRRIR